MKKCLLFTVGSVCRVRLFTTGSRNYHLGGKRLADDAEVETEVQTWLLCCGFRRTGKAMGQMYESWCRKCREINVFFQFRISHVLRFISICDLFTGSPF
jgi:hypothetical protein